MMLCVSENGTLCSDDHSSPAFIILRQLDIMFQQDRHTHTRADLHY